MMTVKVEHPMPLAPSVIPTLESSDTAEISTPTSFTGEPLKQSVSPSSSTGNESNSMKGGSNANAKRPPRKSTLTQQQKNQKRQRATADQLGTLEAEFNKNPTPTASVREAIAEKINMTERSVQIWFQNRRAKIKLLAKKSLETGEDIDSIPESMRAYLAMQAMESGKGLGGSYLGRTGLVPFGHGGGVFLGDDQSGHAKVFIHHLTCRSLSIGKWTRVGQNMMDLIIFYSPDKCTMTYYINNEQAGYKIEYPFAYIKNIYLDNSDGDPNKMGGIVIELNRPPHFFMDSSPTAGGFYQCGDFTEDIQASRCMVHHLGGNPKVMSGQLAKLISLESFMNRHTQSYGESHPLSVSAPVSPTLRPASQPSFPPAHMNTPQEQWSAGLSQMHSSSMRPPQGHKRQRSRSVPGPIDFAMFQNQAMPSFYIQPPGDMGPPQHIPNLYAPVPQQPQSNIGSNLRIDTQAGFGLDMRQYPMSATTASPSEFPTSPGFFSQGHEASAIPTSNMGTPYGTGFLSPMVNADGSATTSMSPLPYNNSAEPSIVDQSPPMSMLGRPGSADMYTTNDGSCAVSEDGHSLNEMYSKHNINFAVHSQSPGFGQGQQHSQQAELDMDQLVQFDAVDTSSLSPEGVPTVSQ